MVFQSKTGCNVEKTVQNSQFKIAANAKLFSILSDGVYVQKIDAVIRELCCNAYDAHIEARQERKFIVKLPSDLDPEFKVRDFGFGLSHEDMSMYTTYGESTKSSSNAYIGAFGIGAKSPFAYTNTFNVTSYQNGKGRAYSMFVEDGAPQMTLLGEFKTDEPSGLEVFFPVRLSDVREFQDKAVRVLAFMADKLEVKGVPDRWHEELDLEVKKYDWIDAPYIGHGYQTSRLTLDTNCSSLHVLQGNVAYEMSASEVSDIFKLAIGKDYDRTVQHDQYLRASFYLSGFIRAPNGTFVPHPSRERLTFDDMTKEGLKNIFSKIFKHFVSDSIDLIIRSVKTYYELYLALQGKSRIIRDAPRIRGFTIDDQNKRVQTTSTAKPIMDFDDWLRTGFSGIMITDSPSGGCRFKWSQLIMMGAIVEKIYFTNKYPLSRDCRCRLIKDMRKSETKSAVIFDGRRYEHLFQPSDEALFVDVQALPKLTQAEQAGFNLAAQNTADKPRVTKEKVSFVTIQDYSSRADFQQKTTDDVMDIASRMHVMWVGSNHRYELPFGDHIYKLKLKGDCEILYRKLEFYLNSVKNRTPNWKGNGASLFGIVVLPEGHQLRSLLPELVESLRLAALFEIQEFLKAPRFRVEQRLGDVFIGRLKKNPLLFDKLLEGYPEKASFDTWRASGMPKGETLINKPRIPFFLWDDSDAEMKEARILYEKERNCVRVDVKNFYHYVSKKHPLFERCLLYGGMCETDVVKELVEYMKFKLGLKPNEE
jgi:hypothetical protein